MTAEAGVDTQPISPVWHCPRCRGALTQHPGELVCASCASRYPVIMGIPDLRVDAPAWVDIEADRQRAVSLSALPGIGSGADLAYHLFRRREGWSEQVARYRADQVRTHPDRLEREFDDWLNGTTGMNAPMLDLGCGSGGLLAAAARRGLQGIGIDVSLEWLVVAQRLIRENGGTPVLAAGVAEALPLRDAAVGAVVSLDVLEHVVDQDQYLREIDRVLIAGGTCALATPNRFSFTPEPHVNVWGVGWVPRAWQSAFVKYRSGQAYDYCKLLSVREVRRMVAGTTSLRARVMPGVIPPEEMERFSRAKAFIARAYNGVASAPGLGALILPIAPFFRVIAQRPGTGGGRS